MKRNEQESIYYVYAHKRSSDGSIFYIGAGKAKRAWSKSGRSAYWNGIARKHGFNVSILKDGLTFDESRQFEIQTIAELRNQGEKLCNLTAGGEGLNGLSHSNDTKLKISKGNKGKNKNRVHTEETRKKMSIARKGKVHTEETRKKISIAQKGIKKTKPVHNKGVRMTDAQKEKLRKPKSEEHKQKCRESALSRWADPEYRSKIKVNNHGMNNPRAVKTRYTFTHVDGSTFHGTRVDFKEFTGVDPKSLFRKRPGLTVKGWSLFQ